MSFKAVLQSEQTKAPPLTIYHCAQPALPSDISSYLGCHFAFSSSCWKGFCAKTKEKKDIQIKVKRFNYYYYITIIITVFSVVVTD